MYSGLSLVGGALALAWAQQMMWAIGLAAVLLPALGLALYGLVLVREHRFAGLQSAAMHLLDERHLHQSHAAKNEPAGAR